MQVPPGSQPLYSVYPESTASGRFSGGPGQNNPFVGGGAPAPQSSFQNSMSIAQAATSSPAGYHHAVPLAQGSPTPPMPFPPMVQQSPQYTQPGSFHGSMPASGAAMPANMHGLGGPEEIGPPTQTNLKTKVSMPRPKVVGSTEFYGSVPKKNSTFAWSELCATPTPECSLAPVPQVHMKTWYNTYIYKPEEKSHVENQFLERYVQGPNGEWLDIVKARRMSGYIEDRREKAMKQQMERAMVMSGSVVHHTDFTDAYSGEQLVACRGELLPKEMLLDEYGIHRNAKETAQMLAEEARASFDFDNLRVPWPFGAPHRNKKISQHAYDWFDRQNPYIRSDQEFQMVELPSMYVDAEHYHRFAGGNMHAGAHMSVPDHALHPSQAYQQQRQTQYVEM